MRLAKLFKTFILAATATTALATVSPTVAQATKKPNILIIWGDDIGGFNISAYNQGVMGYKTPNIEFDRETRRDVH